MESNWREQTYAKANPVEIRSPEADDFRNLTGTSLSKYASFGFIHFKNIRLSFQIWINALSRNVEESFKQSVHSDPSAGDVQI